jgi:hypothetical protein
MFIANMPLIFVARASLGNDELSFRSTSLLLRYRPNKLELGAPPRFLLGDCGPDDEGSPTNGPWIIHERSAVGGIRLFELRLCGAEMDRLICEDPKYPLLGSFLDQTTIELPLNLGPILEAPDAQPRADRQLTASIFLKLLLQVVPAP